MTKGHTCGWQSHATNHKCHQSPSTTTHTPLVMHTPSHTSTHTPWCTHMVGWWWRLDDHTVMTNTPWFDGNHSLHQHHCGAQHPHPTHHSCHLLGCALAIPMPLCDHQWLGKRGVVHAMCCHSTPFTLVHPFALLTHSVCVIGSHSVSNTFTSEQVTVPHTSVKKETVWMAHCKQGTLADAHINPL